MKLLKAEHSIVYRSPLGNPFGYFGWPTVARLKDGRLVAGASGFRQTHIDPFGKTVLWESGDEGKSWGESRILNDGVIDDRDVGLTALPDGGYLVSWFTSDTRKFKKWIDQNNKMWWRFGSICEAWDDVQAKSALGSFVRYVAPDGQAGPVVPIAVSAPHGPVLTPAGTLIYFGWVYGAPDASGKLVFSMDEADHPVACYASRDRGATWQLRGGLPAATDPKQRYEEPHVLALSEDHLLGVIRNENGFSILQTESFDGGRTWSQPRTIIGAGSPPHLLRHSSGTIILTYGYRHEDFGQRVAFSHDDGKTWDANWVIRADGPTPDLGYPSTVELADGSLFSVYYQQAAAGEPCSILASHWTLPKA